MANPTSRPLPPPPPGNGNRTQTAPAQSTGPREFAVVAGRIDSPQRVLLYGPGGIGKSSLAALAPSPIFLDVEGGTREMDVPRLEGVETFADMRDALRSRALDGFETVVLDTATKAEELAVAHTIAHVKHEKGHTVTSIEGYGFGKGLQHVFDSFLLLLADLDAQVRKGRHVLILAHSAIDNVPNPVGDDWIRHEPHLQAPKSGKASIRNRVVQWADHVLFLGYDVMAKDGKGHGSGTRTIYPAELPAFVAKSRRIADPLPYEHAQDGRIWDLILKGAK